MPNPVLGNKIQTVRTCAIRKHVLTTGTIAAKKDNAGLLLLLRSSTDITGARYITISINIQTITGQTWLPTGYNTRKRVTTPPTGRIKSTRTHCSYWSTTSTSNWSKILVGAIDDHDLILERRVFGPKYYQYNTTATYQPMTSSTAETTSSWRAYCSSTQHRQLHQPTNLSPGCDNFSNCQRGESEFSSSAKIRTV